MTKPYTLEQQESYAKLVSLALELGKNSLNFRDRDLALKTREIMDDYLRVTNSEERERLGFNDETIRYLRTIIELTL